MLEPIIFSMMFGLILGPLTARSSQRRQPIYGGPVAQLLHGLGAVLMIAVIPMVLVNLILGNGFLPSVVLGFSTLGTGFLVLLVFAAVEKPALNAHTTAQDHGWTEEDARTSGL